MNESNDSMLTVSDSLGNMDPSDSTLTTEIDRTLLDEFAGDSQLSAENDFLEGDESAPRRVGASGKRHSSRTPPRKSRTHASVPSKPARGTKLAVKSSGTRLRGKGEPMLGKVQKFVQPYREDLSLRFKDIYGAAKARGAVLDKSLRTQPYVFALGALVAGFALAKIVTAGPSRQR